MEFAVLHIGKRRQVDDVIGFEFLQIGLDILGRGHIQTLEPRRIDIDVAGLNLAAIFKHLVHRRPKHPATAGYGDSVALVNHDIDL